MKTSAGSTSTAIPVSSQSSRDRWRDWATYHPVVSSMLAGLVGVHIASVVGFWMGSFGLTRLDWFTANGLVYLPEERSAFAQFIFGGLMHYTDGVLFALLFALALHPLMRWHNTETGNILKALLFGTILAIIALAVLTPLVYAPARGSVAGVFSSNFGWKYILGVFLFHWIYGLHVGLVYNPKERATNSHSVATEAS